VWRDEKQRRKQTEKSRREKEKREKKEDGRQKIQVPEML